MLRYITCYFMLRYITFFVRLYNMLFYVMLHNMLFYVYVMLYLTIIPRGHVGYEMIDSQRGA